MNHVTPERPPPAGRDHLELMTSQLRAIEAWNRAHRVSEAAAEAVAMTREMRLDAARRVEARRREQRALLARAAEQLSSSGSVLSGRIQTRAVLAHRSSWLREAVGKRLEQLGVVVVGAFEDGAEAAGTIVVEQPDLVLVEDRLPTLSGIEVLRRVRAFSPQTVVAAQVLDVGEVQALVDAGAQAVFTRRVPPHEIADGMLAQLAAVGAEAALA